MPKQNYIIIWKDEQAWDAWKDYCCACRCSRSSKWIKIYFDNEDVEEGPSEDEDEA